MLAPRDERVFLALTSSQLIASCAWRPERNKQSILRVHKVSFELVMFPRGEADPQHVLLIYIQARSLALSDTLTKSPVRCYLKVVTNVGLLNSMTH